MTPKVGPNKVRFGRMAADVAPQIARDPDLGALSRSGLADKVGAKLQEAEAALDAAADARNPNRVEYTGPILAELEARKARLTAQTARVGTFKAGEDVVPTPNAPRVAVINQAIDEIKQLGPVVNYDALRQIRQAYDGQAKAVYAPAVTADFLQKQGSKLGAADVTGVLRDRLAKFDPQTAAANATYSFYRSANDVLQAAEETERTRPKVGRQIIARLTGSVVGGEAGGLPGALAGYVAGPIADAVANSGPTLRIGYARKLASLADALRAHDLGKTISVAEQLKQMRPNLALQAAVAGNAIATQSQPNAPALASQP